MKVLIYDPFSGISGDMNLGAMIDLGVDPAKLKSELEKLSLEGYELIVENDQRKGISGTRVDVKLTHDPHHHRNLEDISGIIKASGLGKGVIERSLRMFRKLAEAEGKIHDKPVDKVHFHEVGAIDSIVDIVGAAICLEILAPDKIMSSPVELGGGMVECAHGTFPVPAPATAEILKNIPVRSGSCNMEMCTPTGALILACNVDEFGPLQNHRIQQTAYGIGQRDPAVPNVLRVYWTEEEDQGDGEFEHSESMMIETNIDDMSPEWYSHIMQQLFEMGAEDVYLTPIIMKKTRPATMLSVLCTRELEKDISGFLLLETTSLGIRKYPVVKDMLKREHQILETVYGEVGVKIALYRGNVLKSKPEFDDCQRLAKKHDLPLRTIYQEINKILNQDK